MYDICLKGWISNLACAKKTRIIRKATEQFNGEQKLLFTFVGLKMKKLCL
jgi:hypothetical protein